MRILTEIIGNINHSEWRSRLSGMDIESIYLNQWTAQKSRFIAKSSLGNEFAVALKRNSHIADGDIIYYSPESNKVIVLRLDLNPVMVINLKQLDSANHETIMRLCIELGHALGNQHWPALVKGNKVFVPLTVDRKVMLSVMETHHFAGISYEFQTGRDVIPYLAPHELRRLFGAAFQTHSH
jgi:urease accessory protein